MRPDPAIDLTSTRPRYAAAALLAILACLLGSLAGPARAARFAVSVQYRDTLAWNVAEASSCGRSGSGKQTVEFHTPQPTTLKIARISVALGGHTVRQLRIQGLGAADIPNAATVTREDNTTGFWNWEGCKPIPPKDCGSKPLQFKPRLATDNQAGLTIEGVYWPFGEAPFQNCIALQTPVNLDTAGAFYRGWEFGQLIPTRQDGPPIASRQLSPNALRRGRTYHFAAHAIFQLDDGQLNGYMIDSDGGLGGGSYGQSGAPEASLGGGRSVTDNVSWTVTLRRIR